MLGGMYCETTADAGAFLSTAGDFLHADPILNSVIITNVTKRRDGTAGDEAPATYLVVRDGSEAVVGAAMRTPPHGIVLSPMPAAATEPVVDALLSACPDAVGVSGAVAQAEEFAVSWTGRTKQTYDVGVRMRIHRLDEVCPPVHVPGRARPAAEGDVELIAAWSEAFVAEVQADLPRTRRQTAAHHGMARRDVEARVADGRAWVWEDAGVASYVGYNIRTLDTVRVGPVYTPPERRGRGYASALVAAVSQHLLDDGARSCSLYTDLANPTSNKIYAAVGYYPVVDVTDFRFSAR